jgi:long-chain fatty acid transport protein
LFGSSKAGINLEQLFIAPTIAWKANDKHALGASLIYAQQKFSATGLENFASAASSAPANVTNLGDDTTDGFGYKLGWLGQVSDTVTLGATYQSKISGQFSKYKGLFAEQGAFDIPASYGVGISFKAHPKWIIDADVQRILYSQTASVGNKLSNLTEQGQQLGSSNGPGFGWKDVTVFKLGTRYQASEQLTLRAGYNYSTQPIPSSQTLFNILAPGTVQHHISFGASYAINKNLEVSGYFSHAFAKTVKGRQSIPASFGGGEANVRLSENLFGVSLGWKY